MCFLQGVPGCAGGGGILSQSAAASMSTLMFPPVPYHNVPATCSQPVLEGTNATNPVCVLLRCITWHVLVVFTDDPQFAGFPTAMELERKTQLFVVNASNEFDVDRMLDRNSHPYHLSRLFVIKCSVSCVISLLQKVNAHDGHYQEQGVLTYLCRWIIVENTKPNFPIIEGYAGNITNLSILLWQDGLETGRIYSASWQPSGRRLQFAATVSQGSVSGEVFPNLQYGLNGRRFLVTITPWAPFISMRTDGKGKPHYSGFCIETLKAVAEQMNFTYILILPPDGQWGDVVNGTWTGLVGQLAYKTADMMAAPLAIQARREYVMDSTFPFYIEETAFVYKHIQSPILQSFLFTRPYKWPVWFCLGMLIPSTGVLAWCTAKVTRRIYGQDRYIDPPLHENIWITLGAAFCQGTPIMPKNFVVRLLLIFWVFTCVIYTATYSSNLVALLTVDVVQPPFTSLQDLATQHRYKYGLQGASVYTNIVRNSQGIYKYMWERMKQWEREGFPVISTSHQEQLDLVDRGGYAYLTDATSARYHAAGSCDLRLFNDKLFPLQYGMGFQNNSAYTIEASKIIMRLAQTGLLTKWIHQFWPKQTACLKASRSNSIGVKDLSGLFYVLLACLMVSLGVLCIEVFIVRSHHLLHRRTGSRKVIQSDNIQRTHC